MAFDSLADIRNVAMRMGATIGVRHEWIDIDPKSGKLIIAETGNDVLYWDSYVRMGAQPAFYFAPKAVEGNAIQYNDPYGRLLSFDPETNAMTVLVEGGAGDGKHFSSPDGLSTAELDGKPYAIISEDLIGLSQGRVSAESEGAGNYFNEVYFLELGRDTATVNDLKRFIAAPRNCETTGSTFTPDGSTMFLSIQHPDGRNPEPFNSTCIIAIEGFPAAAPPANAQEPAEKPES